MLVIVGNEIVEKVVVVVVVVAVSTLVDELTVTSGKVTVLVVVL